MTNKKIYLMTDEERKIFIKEAFKNSWDGIQEPISEWNDVTTDEEYWGTENFEEIQESVEKMFFEELEKWEYEEIQDYVNPGGGYCGIAWKLINRKEY